MIDDRLPDEEKLDKFSKDYDGKRIIGYISTKGFHNYFEGIDTNPYEENTNEWHSWNAGREMAKIFA